MRGRGVSTGPTLPPRPTAHPCPAPEQEREQQALGTEGKLLHRQEQELKALRKRISSGAEEQRQARQQDLPYLPYISPISPLYLPYICQARQQDLERLLQRCHHRPPT